MRQNSLNILHNFKANIRQFKRFWVRSNYQEIKDEIWDIYRNFWEDF